MENENACERSLKLKRSPTAEFIAPELASLEDSLFILLIPPKQHNQCSRRKPVS